MVALVNAVMGTLIAWVLVRDRFPGQGARQLADRPAVRLADDRGRADAARALRADRARSASTSPTRGWRSSLALLFVTLPFVVRSVQPVLLELDTEMEEAAASLGAGGFTIFRRVIFPNLVPAILSGVALAFARAVGEFGSVVLISGQHPVQDAGRVGPDLLRSIESDRPDGRGRALRGPARPFVRSRSCPSTCSAAGAVEHDELDYGAPVRCARLSHSAARCYRSGWSSSGPSSTASSRSGTR